MHFRGFATGNGRKNGRSDAITGSGGPGPFGSTGGLFWGKSQAGGWFLC